MSWMGGFKNILRNFVLNDHWCNLIMVCISSFSMQVLFNGESLPPIVPSWALRQGDPLSLYWFLFQSAYQPSLKMFVVRGLWKVSKLCVELHGLPIVFSLLFLRSSLTLMWITVVGLERFKCLLFWFREID